MFDSSMRYLAWTLPALLVACVTGPPRPTKGTAVDPALMANLDQLAADTVARAPLLGLRVLVRRDGQVLLDRSYGMTALEIHHPMTPDTVFRIGSLSKQFTAAAVLQLIDSGKVRLDDPISKYVPQLQRPITLAQLLNQTSGVPNLVGPENLRQTREEITASITSAPSDFPAGTKWAYSNSNYFLLGLVIETASGESYSDYLEHHLFSAAGMTASAVCENGDPPLAEGSIGELDGLQGGHAINPNLFFGAGSLCSTAEDLSRWQLALFGGRIVQPDSLAFMIGPGKLTDGTATSYGAGMLGDEVGGHRRWWHNGAVASGFESELAYYPDDHLQIILLTNTVHFPPSLVLGRLDRELTRAALGIPPLPIQNLPLPLDAEARYGGTYTLAGTTAQVSVRDGQLHSLINGKKDLLLLYQGEDAFVVASNHEGGYHFVIEDGRATSIEISINGAVKGLIPRSSP